MGKNSQHSAKCKQEKQETKLARKHAPQKNMGHLHLQQVHEAVAALNMAIASLPVYDAQMLPEEPFFPHHQISLVALPLVNMIGQVLDGHRVVLLAVGSAGQLSYIAGSGLTAEQEQVLRESKEATASMFFDEQVLARLSAHQEVLLPSQDLCKRPSFAPAFDAENLLVLPLFLEEQFAGALTVFKASSSNGYTREETELAKVLVAEIELLVECLGILRERIKSGTQALVQQEIGRLSNDFLTLANHELRTPLTGIMGNIQLAQQRLTKLKRQIREQSEKASMYIEKIENPLASAIVSAHLQQRVINEMIDALSIPTNPVESRMKEENLLTLLQDTLARLQRSAPKRTIELKLPPKVQEVLVRVDSQQIIQVLTNYLVNALNHSSTEQLVTVELVIADTVALILVHDEGLGTMTEEQKSLWQRFAQREGHAIQYEVDVNLGTGFHLCQMLIERHHGHVGVQSHPEQGTTFWFTLPIEV
ncbi:sensor histidine kinase [Dictyobacter formicarum]|uniref:histidine kinase n=1 Tax=Dictyobacter formicarum TaxID=2778368 RepID=A0ABQ3VUL1_9CHLR|nr:HAMP domain-containing sensor histidine kinase [Dictyobacter formicarum]GHO89503.1 hypothetical protein KSZ_75090 [Dictyobacter formicarum]